ncbi:MAG TPA: hypothetical protein VHJ78_00275 [Actinomycetota bacterium]|nr:hypothetical protein [Actinomycetota bacterium]
MARKQNPDAEQQAPAGPGRTVLRLVLAILGVVVVAVGGTQLVRVAGNVTGGWRIAVAALMGLFIARVGLGYFRYLTNPPPPEPSPVHVDPRLQLSYLCEMCGLELAVVTVARERAPKHCGESMVLVRREEG